ncbi:uncharacterized protein SPPG_06824 [Spizellomyces punctatus DAOM BR117]|uniref:UspA domain-containing protein n=1 Tax=Spizellomyces punctatus (strain DAOM BR117) TaxID=645134 RepID=A0A0L0HAT0_SPIPD|nr:uncharacterized protein SPPG_06824 [Spizellomyces punctatus DAOM BR117]KNC97828.1 hypothetical protein SPPG_06824 [Spizellomyces punctatus DAOM BR117]|eukprot:XP_016605868.1 hypothetical protein SPPG_06824 [Spizellomyces punctatus DAOM BR117]
MTADHPAKPFSRRFHLAMDETPASVNALKYCFSNLLQDGDFLDVITAVLDPVDQNAVNQQNVQCQDDGRSHLYRDHPIVKRMQTLINVIREGYPNKHITVSLHAVCGEPGHVIVEQAEKQFASTLVLGTTPRSHYLMPTGMSLATAMCYGTVSGYVVEHLPPEINVVLVRYVEPKRDDLESGDQ